MRDDEGGEEEEKREGMVSRHVVAWLGTRGTWVYACMRLFGRTEGTGRERATHQRSLPHQLVVAPSLARVICIQGMPGEEEENKKG